MKRYNLGIDLHGTLLDETWTVQKGLIPVLKEQFINLKEYCDIYICTGNDLRFVDEHVDKSIRDEIDGYILETGSVFSNKETEEVLIEQDKVNLIKELERQLRIMELPEVLYFAERKATISIFTKHKQQGKSPNQLHRLVSSIVSELGLKESVDVTHSNVAVDILTSGVNKYTGLRRKAGCNPIIAIADSYNDVGFLYSSDISFVPDNAYNFLQDNTITVKIEPLRRIDNYPFTDSYTQTAPTEKIFYKSSFSHTEGVLDILQTINHLTTEFT